MNTRLTSSDANGNSTENSDDHSIICGINQVYCQQQNKLFSAREVNHLINNVLEQFTDLEEVMMSNDVEDSNVVLDSSKCESEEELIDDELDINYDDDDDDDDATLAGYRFCAEETIRFLINEEHFAPDDPVIIELQQHLEQQQKFLQDRLRIQQQQTMDHETNEGSSNLGKQTEADVNGGNN